MIAFRQGAAASDMAFDALAAVFADNWQGATVLVKPNVGRVAAAGSGVCTAPDVVRGVVRFFKAHGAGRILVGDGPIWGVDIREAMERTGIAAMCREEGVECVDLDGYGSVTLSIPEASVVEKLKFSALIREVDGLVSVPVMKTHMYTGATLGIKNLKGCLYKMEKTKLHRLNRPVPDPDKGRVLDYGIADMARVLLPHYTVVDGMVGLEGLGPSVGTPKPLGVVLASKDAVACDMAALKLMGFELADAPHIALIRERLRPELTMDNLPVDDPAYARFARPFAVASLESLAADYPFINVVEKGTCSACSAALMVFVRTHGTRVAELAGQGTVTLATGKDLASDDTPGHAESVFFIGNCAVKAAAAKGRPCCQGCPPVGSSILAHLRGEPEEA